MDISAPRSTRQRSTYRRPIRVQTDGATSIAVERIKLRGGYIRLEERSVVALDAIRRGYLRELSGESLVVDATLPPEKVFAGTMDRLEPLIEKWQGRVAGRDEKKVGMEVQG